MLILIVCLLLKFCPAAVFVIGNMLLFPFKCIGALFKSIGNSIKKSKVRRREKHKAEKTLSKPNKKQPRAPELNGNITPEEVNSYLDSIDWESVDWAKLDGKGN